MPPLLKRTKCGAMQCVVNDGEYIQYVRMASAHRSSPIINCLVAMGKQKTLKRRECTYARSNTRDSLTLIFERGCVLFEAKRSKKVSDVAFHGQLVSLSVSVTVPCRSSWRVSSPRAMC
jgi:hypothetical protein